MSLKAFSRYAGPGTLLVLCLLAACAEEIPLTASKPDPATAGSSRTPPSQTRIDLAECATADAGQVHFRIGQSVVAVPADAIRDVIPASLTGPITVESVTRELQTQAAQGGGCPAKPIDARLVILEQDLGDPLLAGTVGLLRSPPGGIVAGFADLTRKLQAEAPGNCRQMSSDLIGCVGRETRGQIETDVLYVITTDGTEALASGGPLAARCVLKDKAVDGCNLVDEVPGGVTFDATLAAGTYTTAGLRSARETVVRRIAAMRR